MAELSDNLRERISQLRVDASKKKVVASKHYLKCRTYQRKATEISLDIQKHLDEINRLEQRRRYFESKAQEIERKFSGENNMEFAKKEIEQRKRKAMEIHAKIRACEIDINEEKEKIEEYEKKAKECLKKSEDINKEAKELEMEAVKLELKLVKKK